MRIKATKVFADYINQQSKKDGYKVTATLVKMNESTYRMCVGGLFYFDAEEYGDYDWSKDEYSAILLTYPAGYYACPRYLTTKELVTEFKRNNVKDLAGLNAMIRNICEI